MARALQHLCGCARIQAVHGGKRIHRLAAAFKSAQQRLVLGPAGGGFGQSFIEQGIGRLVTAAYPCRVVVAAQAGGLEGLDETRDQLGAQVLATALLAVFTPIASAQALLRYSWGDDANTVVTNQKVIDRFIGEG